MSKYKVDDKIFLDEQDAIDYLYEEYKDEYYDSDSFCELTQRRIEEIE